MAAQKKLTNKKSIILISIYRLQYVSTATFIDQIPELLDYYTFLKEDFVIAGDINLHMETDELYASKFREILDLYDLNQHVVGPTHIMGHTIDVVITRDNESFIQNVIITQLDLSHHFLIDFDVLLGPATTLMKTISK